MKVLCPRCKQIIDLGYLEKKGDQMAHCATCEMTVAATYKKDGVRRYWEVSFETPMPKKEPPGGGCGRAILIVIVLSILIAMARCDWKYPYEPPDDMPAEELRN